MRKSRLTRIVALATLCAIYLSDPTLAAVSTSPPVDRQLHLEVIVNGKSTHLIGTFKQRTDGKLAVTPAEFTELGLQSDPDHAGADGLLDLERLSGITYRFDAVAQVIRFDVVQNRLLRRQYSAREEFSIEAVEPKNATAGSAYGAVLNYLLFGTTNADLRNFFSQSYQRSALSAALDGRVFTPYGVLSQSFIASATPEALFGSIRLDTTWTYSDTRTLLTYQAGDFISGGLAWTRPVRLGGFQIQRTFALRPDLVTMPVPQVTGSAVVPSTIDVYLNNVRTFSRDIPAGPFQINNLPMVSGAGTQRIVIRDAQGREIVTNQPFYASPLLLRPGLFDFSIEAGYRRLYYGIQSNDYDPDIVASSSLRYGLSNTLTVEAHAEGGAKLMNGGIGANVPLLHFGMASLAFAGSADDTGTGLQYAASVELGFKNINFFARSQRATVGYSDIASVYARPLLPLDGIKLASLKPPSALDQVALTFPLGFNRSVMTLSFTHVQDFTNGRSRILGATYNRPFLFGASLFATVFKDLDGEKAFGLFAGLSRSFGDISASTNVARGPTGTTAGFDLVKTQPNLDGTYGWRLTDYEGNTPYRSAAISYRAPFARIQATADQFGSDTRAAAEVEGAIAFAGGSVFFTKHIHDAFAVVNAGVPGVEVFYENRPVGKTGWNGRLLVPDLRAYQNNILAIDPKNLPLDADIRSTKEIVVPALRSGIVVDFGVAARAQNALLTLRDRTGSHVSAGSQGKLEATGETFVIGYDGKAYLRGLKPANTISVDLIDGGTCRASFAYSPRPGSPVAVDAVCQ